MDDLERAARWIAEASRIVVFTGAGVSAESGIPTFRDALTGLWAQYDPYQLATAEGFAADPALVWRWYAWRRALVRDAEPNEAHRAIAALERQRHAVVVTQNVDGLHARAGAHDVIELHGNIGRAKCFDGCGWAGDADVLEAIDERVPPRCAACGAPARPDVVWFGESLPEDAWQAAEAACSGCDLILVVGTSGLVHPAAGLPILARRNGATVVIVNPLASDLDAIAHLVIARPASAIFASLVPRT